MRTYSVSRVLTWVAGETGHFLGEVTYSVCVSGGVYPVLSRPHSSLFSQSQIQGPAIFSLHILAQACLSLPQPRARPCSAPKTTVSPRHHCIAQGEGSEEGRGKGEPQHSRT